MSRDAAETRRLTAVDQVHADYCLSSYLSSGVTVSEASNVRNMLTDRQAKIFFDEGHAPTLAAGRACGHALDRLVTDSQIEAAIKKALTASKAREARIAETRTDGAQKN